MGASSPKIDPPPASGTPPGSTPGGLGPPDDEGFISAPLRKTWRREINVSGSHGRPTHWLWRTGRGPARRSKYGGKISTVDPERWRQYVRNRKNHK